MKLSIITINLNNHDGLQKTIDSVVAQTFKDFEWIVIDGGSTDGSKELIEQYADHFAYWVSEPDKGIYNAMNKGIRMAKGDYLQFLNSGDWLVDEKTLERCFVHNFSADIAYGNLDLVYSKEKEERVVFPERITLRFLYHESLGHGASFIKRVLFEHEQYEENLKIVSDWSFYVKMMMENRRFEYIDEVVICFDMNGISMTNETLGKQEREQVIAQLFPKMLVKDYKLMDEMEIQLNQDRIKKVREYSKKKKLYRKMITGCLQFIELIDRVF